MAARASRLGLWLAAALLPTGGMPSASADAGDGFYAGLALERSVAGVDYEKSVEFASPFSAMTAGDRVRDAVDALHATLGYRWPLSRRLYLAGEIAGAVYVDGEVSGFLEGTGEGGADVWPGAWSLQRNRAVGLNARLGYVPPSPEWPGPVRSLYLIVGTRWMNADIEARHVNRAFGIDGARDVERRLNPWLAGIGVEFGGGAGRFDLRLSYAADDVAFGFGAGEGDGPGLGYAFEIREWAVSLGYVVPFGD